MRVGGSLVLALVLAAGVVLWLGARDVDTSLAAVTETAASLREAGREGAALDRAQAAAMVAALDGLIANPERVSEHAEDLAAMSDTAAAWAAAAPPLSAEMHASVSLRIAVGELRSYGLRPSAAALERARRKLVEARASLASGPGGADRPPGLATDGLRDQLQNLEQAAREQQLEVDRALER